MHHHNITKSSGCDLFLKGTPLAQPTLLAWSTSQDSEPNHVQHIKENGHLVLQAINFLINIC